MKKIIEIVKESGKVVRSLVDPVKNPEFFTKEVVEVIEAPEKEVKKPKTVTEKVKDVIKKKTKKD